MKQNKNKSKTINYTFFFNHSPLLFTAQLHKCSILTAHACNQLLLFTKCKNTLQFLVLLEHWQLLTSLSFSKHSHSTVCKTPYFSDWFFSISTGSPTYPWNAGVAQHCNLAPPSISTHTPSPDYLIHSFKVIYNYKLSSDPSPELHTHNRQSNNLSFNLTGISNSIQPKLNSRSLPWTSHLLFLQDSFTLWLVLPAAPHGWPRQKPGVMCLLSLTLHILSITKSLIHHLHSIRNSFTSVKAVIIFHLVYSNSLQNSSLLLFAPFYSTPHSATQVILLNWTSFSGSSLWMKPNFFLNMN